MKKCILCISVIVVGVTFACTVDFEVKDSSFICNSDEDCLSGFECLCDPNSTDCEIPDPKRVCRDKSVDIPDDCEDLDKDDYQVGLNCNRSNLDCDDDNPNIYPGAEEICDGKDNDCDTEIDEDLVTENCPLQRGVCIGAQRSCTEGRWQDCNVDGLYGPEFEPGTESLCDGLDNNCNGNIDENCECRAEDDPPRLCGDAIGMCQEGVRYCLESGQWDEDCVLADNPEVSVIRRGEFQEVCGDGIDNDCDGNIDNNCPNTGRCPIYMAPVALHDSTFCMFIYEASRYDADTTQAGVDDRVRSRPGAIPWTGLNADEANSACEHAGRDMRLCSAAEYIAACRGDEETNYPYGDSFESGVCNDSSSGREIASTGSFQSCTSTVSMDEEPGQFFDLSGNISEWVRNGNIKKAAGGSFLQTDENVSCDFLDDNRPDTYRGEDVGFRCCYYPRF